MDSAVNEIAHRPIVQIVSQMRAVLSAKQFPVGDSRCRPRIQEATERIRTHTRPIERLFRSIVERCYRTLRLDSNLRTLGWWHDYTCAFFAAATTSSGATCAYLRIIFMERWPSTVATMRESTPGRSISVAAL